MNSTRDSHFSKQAIILLSAQAPKDQDTIEEFNNNLAKLMNIFEQFDLGQRILVLGDKSLINETLLKSTDWLFAYNSAYEQPMMTSLQRGISLLDDDISSATIWPCNEFSKGSDTIKKMLKTQKDNLDKVIDLTNETFPLCVPKKYFDRLLNAQPTTKVEQHIKTDIFFTI
ncbi:MAG: hypothetical protein VX835_03890 [Pseudomonadota bacterium]|nr:hypothetical protein [Pseudomonadota bacterium]